MTSDDDLKRFFEEERRRDTRDAPPFPPLLPSGETDGRSPRRPSTRRLQAGVLAAAAALAVVGIRAVTSEDPPAGTHAPGDSLRANVDPYSIDSLSTDVAIDLDTACDAALAALDEHEQYDDIEIVTDALLDAGTESSDQGRDR